MVANLESVYRERATKVAQFHYSIQVQDQKKVINRLKT